LVRIASVLFQKDARFLAATALPLPCYSRRHSREHCSTALTAAASPSLALRVQWGAFHFLIIIT
jgi:hypothetical protein